jgi:hypothetical protein
VKAVSTEEIFILAVFVTEEGARRSKYDDTAIRKAYRWMM